MNLCDLPIFSFALIAAVSSVVSEYLGNFRNKFSQGCYTYFAAYSFAADHRLRGKIRPYTLLFICQLPEEKVV